MQESEQVTMLIETMFCGLCNWNLVSLVGHTCFTCSALWFSQFLDTSANIDAQMKEREQGTVIVETVFCYPCHWNLVSFIVHDTFTCVIFDQFMDVSAGIDAPM